MPKKYDQSVIDAVLKMVREGQPYKTIAEQLGVTDSYISRVATNHGLRRQIDSSKVNWRIVRCLYEDGMSIPAISDKTGISNKTILRHLRAYKYKIRTRTDYSTVAITDIVRLREVHRLSWMQMSKLLPVNAHSLRVRYQRYMKNRGIEPMRWVCKPGRPKKRPQ